MNQRRVQRFRHAWSGSRESLESFLADVFGAAWETDVVAYPRREVAPEALYFLVHHGDEWVIAEQLEDSLRELGLDPMVAVEESRQ